MSDSSRKAQLPAHLAIAGDNRLAPIVTRSPRLRTLSPPPEPPTPLIGRERELTDAIALLRRDDVRILTLTGPGGIGKTRFSIALAGELTFEFADGVIWVPLSLVRDPALIIPAIAQRVEVTASSSQSLLSGVAAALRDQRVLLILDNFEQIVEGATSIANLLTQCPRLKVLVTSRELLHVRGEQVLPLPPLSLPNGSSADAQTVTESAAVRLFLERARAMSPSFDLTATSGAQIVEICRRLDGLPLAIELAAARVNHLSISTLADRLERRLPLLTGGARDLPDRLRTMRDAIAWSHELLSPLERQLFHRLSVFAATFTLEAAEAVAGNDNDRAHVLDGLASLVGKSLIVHETIPSLEPRYSMLETIREFGQELLASDPDEQAHTRLHHARWYLDLAQRSQRAFFTSGEREAMDVLETEYPNLREALAWFLDAGELHDGVQLAAALAWFWHLRGPVSDGDMWMERYLDAIGMVMEPVHADLVAGAGLLSWTLGQYDLAEERLGQALAIFRERHDLAGMVRALNWLALVTASRDDIPATVVVNEEALVYARAWEDKVWIGCTLGSLGYSLIHSGDIDRARDALEEATVLQREVGYEPGLSWAVTGLGHVCMLQGDAAGATVHYQDALRLMQRNRGMAMVAHLLPRIASAHAATGSPDRAARLLGAAASLQRSAGILIEGDPSSGYAATVETVRAALGDERFRAGWVAGSRYTPDEALTDALTAASSSTPAATGFLTARERDVLQLLTGGLTDRAIGERLFIGTRTVESHVARIFQKLGVRTRAAAAAMATANGLVTSAPSPDPATDVD